MVGSSAFWRRPTSHAKATTRRPARSYRRYPNRRVVYGELSIQQHLRHAEPGKLDGSAVVGSRGEDREGRPEGPRCADRPQDRRNDAPAALDIRHVACAKRDPRLAERQAPPPPPPARRT